MIFLLFRSVVTNESEKEQISSFADNNVSSKMCLADYNLLDTSSAACIGLPCSKMNVNVDSTTSAMLGTFG